MFWFKKQTKLQKLQNKLDQCSQEFIEITTIVNSNYADKLYEFGKHLSSAHKILQELIYFERTDL